MPHVGLQDLQEEVGAHGPTQGRHAQGEEEAQEDQRGLRRAEEEDRAQPQPAATQGGDFTQRHQLHRAAAGAAADAGRAGQKRIIPQL